MDATQKYSQERFNRQVVKTLAALRISFNSVENIAFQRLIRMASEAPKERPAQLLSSKEVRRHLEKEALEARDKVFRSMPDGCKISVAADCWTSPNHLAFLAITGYDCYFDCYFITRLLTI